MARSDCRASVSDSTKNPIREIRVIRAPVVVCKESRQFP